MTKADYDELVRARERLDGLNDVFECDGNLEDSEAAGIAIKLIDAELDRERNPKTCDGCRDEGLLYCGNCIECVRARNYTDNYEPKGEKS